MTLKQNLKPINGILLVNKPKGLTSNAVLQQVKRLFQAKKAGHTGSLDPMATGMLPICFGEATKFSQYLLDADKCYEVTGLLGSKTNTGDAMGEVIAEVADFTVSKSELEKILQTFMGHSKQIPSMFSALKFQGKPLYKYARAGIDIPREARSITVHQLALNEFDGRNLSLTVVCSKGTYIRNLVEDIGEHLGMGAHVTRLHRLYTAGFENEKMVALDELQSMSCDERMSYLLPLERAIEHFPRLDLDNESIQALRQGKVLNDITIKENARYFRLYQSLGVFIGLGEVDTGQLKAKRLLAHGFNDTY